MVSSVNVELCLGTQIHHFEDRVIRICVLIDNVVGSGADPAFQISGFWFIYFHQFH